MDAVASKLSGASARKTESKGPRRNAPNGKRSSDLDFYSTLAMDAIEEEVEPVSGWMCVGGLGSRVLV